MIYYRFVRPGERLLPTDEVAAGYKQRPWHPDERLKWQPVSPNIDGVVQDDDINAPHPFRWYRRKINTTQEGSMTFQDYLTQKLTEGPEPAPRQLPFTYTAGTDNGRPAIWKKDKKGYIDFVKYMPSKEAADDEVKRLNCTKSESQVQEARRKTAAVAVNPIQLKGANDPGYRPVEVGERLTWDDEVWVEDDKEWSPLWLWEGAFAAEGIKLRDAIVQAHPDKAWPYGMYRRIIPNKKVVQDKPKPKIKTRKKTSGWEGYREMGRDQPLTHGS